VNWELNCPHAHAPALIRTQYAKQQYEPSEWPGLYRFSNWLPINRILEGSAAPVTYRSEGLARELGLRNLYITFSGYWPEKGALMKTGSFKECEAYTVCARENPYREKIMVLASAGNTARAFAKVCSENRIPLLICIPEDNLNALWFEKPLDRCVKIVASEQGADYFDAIHVSNIVAGMDAFYPEGGAKNVARRDGMGTTVLSAVETIGSIPDYYFQAIGSGTGAIAAWEANLRFLADGRFGSNKMKLMLAQNEPFIPIKEAWGNRSRNLPVMDEKEARKKALKIDAKVLSNRQPPYSLIGGLYDALTDTGCDVLSANNHETAIALSLFKKSEGIDIDLAAAVAVASLIETAEKKKIEKDACIMLNITGGGVERFQCGHKLHFAKAEWVFPVNPDPESVRAKVSELFAM